MILIAQGWRRCCYCREIKPNGQFGAKTRYPSGWPRTRQSYCKVCHRRRERELYGYKPRAKAMTREQANERRKQLRRIAADERLRDPAKLADWRADQRMRATLYRKRSTDRVYPPRRVVAGQPIAECHRPPTKAEAVPAAPFVAYLREQFRGWSAYEIAAMHGHVLERRISAVLNGEQDRLELDAVDRFLTIGMGRPDLLNALYPPEAP